MNESPCTSATGAGAKADYCTRLVKRTKVPFIISDKVVHPCEMVINAGRSMEKPYK